MHGEHVPRLQTAPGTLVAEHAPDQLQSDRKGDLGPVVVAGEVGREEFAETVSPIRRLHAEVDEPGDCGLADLQPIDA